MSKPKLESSKASRNQLNSDQLHFSLNELQNVIGRKPFNRRGPQSLSILTSSSKPTAALTQYTDKRYDSTLASMTGITGTSGDESQQQQTAEFEALYKEVEAVD